MYLPEMQLSRKASTIFHIRNEATIEPQTRTATVLASLTRKHMGTLQTDPNPKIPTPPIPQDRENYPTPPCWGGGGGAGVWGTSPHFLGYGGMGILGYRGGGDNTN